MASLKTAVATGEYPTKSEIIREALRAWHVKRELRGDDLNRLRELWTEGQASGPATRLNLQELRQEACQHTASRKPAILDRSP